MMSDTVIWWLDGRWNRSEAGMQVTRLRSYSLIIAKDRHALRRLIPYKEIGISSELTIGPGVFCEYGRSLICWPY